MYEGGGGYAAAKHAQTALAETLRLELCGRPVRVIEIDPGMVRTDEFALIRFGGDAERADAVYAGVAEPLVADDIADCVAWCATRPHHVNIDRLVVRPLAQAAQHKVHRVDAERDAAAASATVTRGHHEPEPAAPGGQLDRVPAAATCCATRPIRWWSTSGYGATPVTAVELRGAAGRAVRAGRPGGRAGDRPGTGGRGRSRPPTRRGWSSAAAASSWPACARWWCGRSTCCGSTTRPRWPAAWRHDDRRARAGRRAGRGHLRRAGPARRPGWPWTRPGPRSLTLAARLSTWTVRPRFAERLPKALIHHNVPGEPVHALLRALDGGLGGGRARTPRSGRGSAGCARWPRCGEAGWPVLDRPARWRLGELTVAWPAVAPGG